MKAFIKLLRHHKEVNFFSSSGSGAGRVKAHINSETETLDLFKFIFEYLLIVLETMDLQKAKNGYGKIFIIFFRHKNLKDTE